MPSQLRPALMSLGIAQVVFPGRASGSLIVRHEQPVGSALIGQPVNDPKYFWGRLSATGPASYTAFNADKLTGSSGSNYGPLNAALLDAVQARIKALQEADSTNTVPIPVDLVTASGSGLDPHISPAAAAYQVFAGPVDLLPGIWIGQHGPRRPRHPRGGPFAPEAVPAPSCAGLGGAGEPQDRLA
jgi:K+-transporting ATPase KdpC subunit